MAQRRRNTYSRGEDSGTDSGRRPRPSRNQGPNLVPLLGVVAIVAVAGIGFAIYANNNKRPRHDAQDAGKAASEVDPFAGVPEESGPYPMSPGGKRAGLVDHSPADLLDDPIWVAAATEANEWYVKHKQAQDAFKAKDNKTYLELGPKVLHAFEKLIEETAEWEVELIDKYGENDRRVSQIKAERDKWFAILRKYKGL